LEERRNRADLIELFKIYKGFTTVHFESLFTLDRNNKGTRGTNKKLVCDFLLVNNSNLYILSCTISNIWGITG